ncbi:EthD domain-containing protein [Bradyrhizobium manausense]
MIKLTACACRLPTLTREEFDKHWRERHAALIRKHAATLRIRGYVQTPTLDNPTVQEAIRATRDAEVVPYDGIAELWWDSLEELQAARSTPEGLAALKELIEDERLFQDPKRSRLWFGTERHVIPPPERA